MIFALGFLGAGLLTLLFLPAVWRRAMRLSARRVQMQLPLSVGEIVAERDQLRAGYAVERRRMEQKYEALHEIHAADFADLGRRAARMVQLADQIDSLASDKAKLELEGADLTASLADARAEAGALHVALYESDGLRERREAQLRSLEDAYQILQITSGQQRIALADLDSRHAVATGLLRATEAALETAQGELAQRRDEIEALSGERNQARAQAQFFAQRRDVLQGDLAALGEKAAALEAWLADARAQIAAGARETAQRAEMAARHEQLFQDIEARHKAAQERAERALNQARESERETARRLETARGEKAATEGALQATRDERSRLQRELSLAQSADGGRLRASPAAAPDDEAALRRAVSDLAARLLRLHGAQTAAQPPAAAALPPLRARPKKPVDKLPAGAEPPAG